MIPRNRRFGGLGRLVGMMGLVVILGSAALWGQAADRPVGPAPATKVLTPPAERSAPAGIDPATGKLPGFGNLFWTSPVINSLIAALSVVSVALFIAFMATISTGRMIPPVFLEDVTKLVLAKRYSEAADFCRNNRHIFAASIVQRCVENADKDHNTLMNIIDAEGKRRADVLWNRVSYLVDLSTVAPMLGLLGTVLGMLKAFLALPTGAASLNNKLLAMSIGQAMSATFFGLIVAIMAIVFYTLVRSRTTGTLAEVESSVHAIADHMKRGAK